MDPSGVPHKRNLRERGLEEGFTPLPHEILDRLCCAHLSSPAREVIDVAVRNIIGYPNRDCYPMAVSFLAKLTRRHPNVVSRALQELKARNILYPQTPATFHTPASWAIRPPEEWLGSPDVVRVTVQGDSGVTAGGESSTTLQGDSGSPSEVRPVPPCKVTILNKRKYTSGKKARKQRGNTPLPPSRGNSSQKGATSSTQDSIQTKVEEMLLETYQRVFGFLKPTTLTDGQREQVRASIRYNSTPVRLTRFCEEFRAAAEGVAKSCGLPGWQTQGGGFLSIVKARRELLRHLGADGDGRKVERKVESLLWS